MFFNITALIIDIPHCKPRHFPFGGGLPPPHIEPNEQKQIPSQSVSQCAGTQVGSGTFCVSSSLTGLSLRLSPRLSWNKINNNNNNK